MALPKNRQTKSRTNKRRAHHALNKVALSSCPKCKEPTPSHVACRTCGTYKKREVVDVFAKLDKKEKKKKKEEKSEQEE